MGKLILIDGNAMMHRAYHAMPELTSRKGMMVNAVYGFFSMFLQILNDQKPDYLAVCFDRSKPTIRQTMYVGYHANRPKMETNLSSQFVVVDELLKQMKVATFALDGYEGDDLIGTIATRATQSSVSSSQLSDISKSVSQSVSPKTRQTDKQKNQQQKTENREPMTDVVVVTGDRDMLQLVNKHVTILMPQNGLGKTMLYDEEKVEERYGVKASQFIDYKALIGDPSDGYPGVAGIGPKTAAHLLQQFDTFENIYNKLDEVPQKYALKLAADAEQAALAKKLAAIITDVPIQFSLADCACKDFDLVSLHRAFAEHGFMSLLHRLETRFPDVKEKAYKKTRPQLDLFD